MEYHNSFNINNISNRSLQNFFPKRALKENINNNNNNFVKKIFKIAIYIYYYEKEIKEIKKKKDKDFYLINYEWIIEFKKISEYEQKSKIFSNINSKFNYTNLETNFEELYNYFVTKKTKINFKPKNEFIKLNKVNNFIPSQIREKEIYYIIPSEIIEAIKSCFFENKNLDISPVELSYINNNKIMIKNKNIIKLGNLNETLNFSIQYIFNYFSIEIAKSEMDYLKNNDINDYIKDRRCKPDIHNFQTMKKNFKEIGKLNIIKNIEVKKEMGEKNEIKNSKVFQNKHYSRNINDNQNVQYLTEKNSPVKNEINKNKINNNYFHKIKPQKVLLNNKNNNNKFRNIINTKYNNRINDKEKEKEKYSVQTYNNINYNKEGKIIERHIKKEEPKIEENIIKKENNEDKYQILEKNMNEKLNNLSQIIEDKYNQIRNYLEDKNKKINKQFEEIINYNKKMNEKFDNFKNEEKNKLEQSLNEIKQLKEQLSISKDKLNEFKNIIKGKEIEKENDKKRIDALNKELNELKEINKKLNEEKIEKQNNEIVVNNENNEQMQQFNEYYNSINTNIVLKMKQRIKLVGLKNIGQEPFINSVLHCLFQIKPLINYFKNSIYIDNINNNLKLSFIFKESIMKMCKINEGSLSPEKIIKTFNEINNEEKRDIIKFNNIYTFLESILKKLHEELKAQDNNNNNIDKIKNRLNKLELESYKKSIKNEKSIITDLFQGINEEVHRCLIKINYSIYKFNPFLFLSIDLNKEKFQQNTINIFNCLINMKKEQNYNKEFCEICEENSYMSIRTRILLCPEYLIIMLKYNNNEINNYIKVSFEENLDITNFTKLENDNKYDNKIFYNINGIITKVNNNYDAKYIAYYKNNDNDNWYRFDDEDIRLSNNNIKNEIGNHEIPLILFYKISKIIY